MSANKNEHNFIFFLKKKFQIDSGRKILLIFAIHFEIREHYHYFSPFFNN